MNEVISFAQSDVILKVMSISANKIAAFKFIWKILLKRKWNIILVSYKQQTIYFWHEFSFLIQMLYINKRRAHFTACKGLQYFSAKFLPNVLVKKDQINYYPYKIDSSWGLHLCNTQGDRR